MPNATKHKLIGRLKNNFRHQRTAYTQVNFNSLVNHWSNSELEVEFPTNRDRAPVGLPSWFQNELDIQEILDRINDSSSRVSHEHSENDSNL